MATAVIVNTGTARLITATAGGPIAKYHRDGAALLAMCVRTRAA